MRGEASRAAVLQVEGRRLADTSAGGVMGPLRRLRIRGEAGTKARGVGLLCRGRGSRKANSHPLEELRV